MFYYKTFRSGSNFLLAICDEDIVGKTIKQGDIEFKITETFYKDEKCSSGKIKSLSREATIINAVGKNIIKLLIEEGLIDNERILEVEGVPIAQMMRM